MDRTPILFSFFSGSGFLDLGFETVGFETGYANEYHKPFMDAYKYARRQIGIAEPRFGYFNGSIEECLNGIESEHIKKSIAEARSSKSLVGFIGGPPCPDFSVGGKNRGHEGENGRLSQTYVNLICKHKPDFFLFENVKGLTRTKKHKEFFEKIKKQLEEGKLGYRLTEKLINSLEYGVAQNRERIILFGIRKDNPHSKNIKKFPWDTFIKYSADEIIKKVRTGDRGSMPEELTVQYWFEKNKVDIHPNAKHYFTPRAALEKFQTIEEGDNQKKSFKRLHRFEYSPTAAYGNNEVHIHPTEPRRISAAEALAIQSLPEKFELPPDMSLTNMFKTVGNGVPFLAAQGIAKSVKLFIANK